MDISVLAGAVIALLSPYFAKAGEETAKQAGAAAWKKMAEIHQLIKARFKKEGKKEGFTSPAQALEQFEQSPETRKGAMQDALVEVLGKDPGLATTLFTMLKEIETAAPSFVTQVLGGEVGQIINAGTIEGGIHIGKLPKR